MKSHCFFFSFILWFTKDHKNPKVLAHELASTLPRPTVLLAECQNAEPSQSPTFHFTCNITCLKNAQNANKSVPDLCPLETTKCNMSQMIFVILGKKDRNAIISCDWTSDSKKISRTWGLYTCSHIALNQTIHIHTSTQVRNETVFPCLGDSRNYSLLYKHCDIYFLCGKQNWTKSDHVIQHIFKTAAKDTALKSDLKDIQWHHLLVKQFRHLLVKQFHQGRRKRTDISYFRKNVVLLKFRCRRGVAEYRHSFVKRLKRAARKSQVNRSDEGTKQGTVMKLRSNDLSPSAVSKENSKSNWLKEQFKGKNKEQESFKPMPNDDERQTMNIQQLQKQSDLAREIASNENVTSASASQNMSFTGMTEKEYKKWLREQTIRWQLKREGQYAYLCLVFVICLMLLSLWCMRGFHNRNAKKKAITFHDDSHLLTVKEVLFRKARYLPMFNRDDEWEEVFVHDCGNDP